jgi:hypothetical protein
MNEKIKELMLDAGYAAPEIAVRAQKLSELIIKECTDICDDNGMEYFRLRKASDDFQEKNNYSTGEVACESIRKKIVKMFGV